jgi:hypothetical protein
MDEDEIEQFARGAEAKGIKPNVIKSVIPVVDP